MTLGAARRRARVSEARRFLPSGPTRATARPAASPDDRDDRRLDIRDGLGGLRWDVPGADLQRNPRLVQIEPGGFGGAPREAAPNSSRNHFNERTKWS